MKQYDKSNRQLIAVCMFCATTNTVKFNDYSKYYEKSKCNHTIDTIDGQLYR